MIGKIQIDLIAERAGTGNLNTIDDLSPLTGRYGSRNPGSASRRLQVISGAVYGDVVNIGRACRSPCARTPATFSEHSVYDCGIRPKRLHLGE